MSQRNNQRANRYGDSESILNSSLFNFGSKLALSVLVIIIFLTFIQCTVKKPEAPTWDTQLTIPVVNRTYSMAEIIDKLDQDGIGLDQNNNVTYTIDQGLDTFTIAAAQLTTPDLSYSLSQQLGIVNINPPSIAPVILDATSITGLSLFIPGVIPPANFNFNNVMPTVTSFSSATISSGQAYAIVSNNLGFDLDSVQVEIYDLIYNQSLGTTEFVGGVADGSSDSVLFDFTGITVSNSLETRVQVSTLGGTVLSASGKNISTAIRFAGALSVSSATAEVPALSYGFTSVVSLAETDPIYHASLSGGSLQLDISNQTGFATTLDISFPDIINSGQPFSIQRSLLGNSTDQVTINLAGYEIMPNDSALPQNLAVDITASVANSAPQQIAFDQADQFMVNATMSNLAFDTISGLFSTVGTVVPPTQQIIDVPIGFDSLQLTSAILTLQIENAIALPGTLNINLQGNNGKSINLSGNIAPGLNGTAVISYIVDSSVANFLSPIPSIIDISGSASFGDGFTVGTVTSSDYIYASVNIIAPLEVIIPETSIMPDIQRETIDTADMKTVIDHVIEARLIYNVINHLPIGARVNLFLSGDSATLMTNPQLSITNNIFVTAAPSTSGIVTDTISTGYQTIILDSLDIKILENDTLFIGSELILESSNGLPVRLTNSDYLTIVGRVEVEYRFDGKF